MKGVGTCERWGMRPTEQNHHSASFSCFTKQPLQCPSPRWSSASTEVEEEMLKRNTRTVDFLWTILHRATLNVSLVTSKHTLFGFYYIPNLIQTFSKSLRLYLLFKPTAPSLAFGPPLFFSVPENVALECPFPVLNLPDLCPSARSCTPRWRYQRTQLLIWRDRHILPKIVTERWIIWLFYSSQGCSFI